MSSLYAAADFRIAQLAVDKSRPLGLAPPGASTCTRPLPESVPSLAAGGPTRVVGVVLRLCWARRGPVL